MIFILELHSGLENQKSGQNSITAPVSMILQRNLFLRDFWDRWFRIFGQNLKIQNGGFNMAPKLFKVTRIRVKLSAWGFSGSLISILLSKFKNSKWWIQYGVEKCEITRFCLKLIIWGVFGVGDFEFGIQILKFKMADLIWRWKFLKLPEYAWKFLRGCFQGR